MLDDICSLPVLNGEEEAASFKNHKRFQTFTPGDLAQISKTVNGMTTSPKVEENFAQGLLANYK